MQYVSFFFSVLEIAFKIICSFPFLCNVQQAPQFDVQFACQMSIFIRADQLQQGAKGAVVKRPNYI